MVSMVDYNIMRKQYEYIWKQNLTCVKARIVQNEDAQDYFNLGESKEIVETNIYLNLQGVGSGHTVDKDFMNIISSRYKVYSQYDLCIKEQDFIILQDKIYRVSDSSLNVGIFNGLPIFKEFEIVYVGEEN